MRVNLNGQDYFVQWKHLDEVDHVVDYILINKAVAHSNPWSYGFATLCDIREVQSPEPGSDKRIYNTIYSGHSICREEDLWVTSKGTFEVRQEAGRNVIVFKFPDDVRVPFPKLKYNGRKRSLEHALLRSKFSKAERAIFWDTFNTLWEPKNQ